MSLKIKLDVTNGEAYTLCEAVKEYLVMLRNTLASGELDLRVRKYYEREQEKAEGLLDVLEKQV